MKNKKVVIDRNLNREELYTTYLSLLSSNYNIKKRLTDTEKYILVRFMLLDEPKFYYNRFSSVARKKIKQEENYSSTYMNNYINALKAKGYLLYDSDKILCLAPIINNVLDADKLEINFNFTLKNESGI